MERVLLVVDAVQDDCVVVAFVVKEEERIVAAADDNCLPRRFQGAKRGTATRPKPSATIAWKLIVPLLK